MAPKVFVVLVLCAPAACTFLAPLDDLTGGVIGGDASAPEAGDAGSLGDAAHGECGHAFCADFDGVEPLAAWSRRAPAPNGTIEVTTSRFASSPASLHVSKPRADAKVESVIGKSFDGPWRRVVLDLDVYVPQPAFAPDDNFSSFVGVSFFSGTTRQGVSFSYGASATTLGAWDASGYLGGKGGPAMAFGAWTHLHLDVTPGGAVSGTLGSGADRATYAWTLPSQAAGAQPSVEVAAGILGFNSPLPDLDVYVDNVVVDLE